MEAVLDPTHFLSASLFFLLRKYTQHTVSFVKGAKIDRTTIEELFEGSAVQKYICILLQYLEKEQMNDTEDILKESVGEVSILKNVFYSLLYTDRKFLGKIKKELKNKESRDNALYQFETHYSEDMLREELKKLLKPKETCRFPPEPSGYLHLGHVKAAFLNNDKADNLIVRFDDTNQEKSSDIYEKAILEDLKILQLKTFTLSRSSDFFSRIVEFCEKLIKEEKAYCDDTDKDKMNEERMNGIESKRRNTEIQENLFIFNKMKNNGLKETSELEEDYVYEKYCVRAKISFDHDNKTLRDPVIYRLKNSKHPRTNSRFSPTYDFSCPIVDSLEKITSVLRTNEYRDRNEQYFWFLDALNLNKPKIQDFSRLNFENTFLSKRKLRNIIEENRLNWDDPRFPTVRGILRLGLHVNVLKDYIKLQGMKQSAHVASWDKIWAMNKKFHDKICSRYFAIKEEGKYLVTFVDENGNKISPYERIIKWPLNKKKPECGKKEVLTTNIAISKEDGDVLQLNEEFTLMIVGNCVVVSKTPGHLICRSNPDGDIKKTKNKISWISLDDSESKELVTFSELLTDGVFNQNSKHTEKIIVEKASKLITYGETVQFERIAFVTKDRILDSYIVLPYTVQKRER